MKLLTSGGWKTYLAAAGLVGLAIYQLSQGEIQAAIQSFLAALAALGIRHAVGRAESAAAADPFLPRSHFGLFLAFGLAIMFAGSGCTMTVKHEQQFDPCKGCNCCIDCKCCGKGCDCKPGNKCCVSCDCKRMKGFELSALPTAPPEMYCVLNDGARNGWWALKDGGWGWWHDGLQYGVYVDGKWQRHQQATTSAGKPAPVFVSYPEPAPWLAHLPPSGVNQSKLATSGERLLISGESK